MWHLTGASTSYASGKWNYCLILAVFFFFFFFLSLLNSHFVFWVPAVYTMGITVWFILPDADVAGFVTVVVLGFGGRVVRFLF